jgi:hypothetical protein
MNFLNYKIIGAPKKFKHQPRPLVWSSSLKFGQNFLNLSHETVPLKLPQPRDPQETRTPGFVWLLQVPHFQTPKQRGILDSVGGVTTLQVR